MKKLVQFILLMVPVITVCQPVDSAADDACIFDVIVGAQPLIGLYFDSGPDMEQVVWSGSFNYLENWGKAENEVFVEVLDQEDRSVASAGPDDTITYFGFTNPNGYAVYEDKICLVESDSYQIDTSKCYPPTIDRDDIDNETGMPGWTINGRTVYLPWDTTTSFSVQLKNNTKQVAANIGQLRYTANYLNWLFYSAERVGGYSKDNDGTDLPSTSRMYEAKRAIYDVVRQAGNRAKFAIYYFNGDSGATQSQPFKELIEVEGETWQGHRMITEFATNLGQMKTVNYSPLAEGLVDVGEDISAESGAHECADRFALVITPGVSSSDYGNSLDGVLKTGDLGADGIVSSLSDADGDSADCADTDEDGVFDYPADCTGTVTLNVAGKSTEYEIPVGFGGSTYLDDVAAVLYGLADNPVYTYTLGLMATDAANAYLENTSNNGNGIDSLGIESGKYHYATTDMATLAADISEAIHSMFGRTNIFVAPVVPVTETKHGARVYLSFFTPRSGGTWEGNMVKYGLQNNQIVDSNGKPATDEHGVLKPSEVPPLDDEVAPQDEVAPPYWETEKWALPYSDPGNKIGVLYSARKIYTYFGNSDLTNPSNHFLSDNAALSDVVLDIPSTDYWGLNESWFGREELIHYVRGGELVNDVVLHPDLPADLVEYIVQYEIKAENRGSITGDILHSEPAIFDYFADEDDPGRRMIYFGANDGMLHAVNDSVDVAIAATDGTEAWAFIPPNQLSRLRNLLGDVHTYFVDSTPMIYHHDIALDEIEAGDGFVNGDDQVILVSGLRKGGRSYFALDVTDPDSPKYLWEISPDSPVSYPMLGESWSEPSFGKTWSGEDTVPVMIVGAGFDSDETEDVDGNAVLMVNALNGVEVKKFTSTGNPAMKYSIPSRIAVADIDSNDSVDKLYVGDLGGQLWRIGRFTDEADEPLTFPSVGEDVDTWQHEVLFNTNPLDGDVPVDPPGRSIFYPPAIVLEFGYDMILGATGDREDPCVKGDTEDIVFAVKDDHQVSELTVDDLARTDIDPLENSEEYQGWYYQLEPGEKVLSGGTVFANGFYFTTFTPRDDPCEGGGTARLYALHYKTGEPFMDLDNNQTTGDDDGVEPYIDLGYGIPSKPVIIITDDGPRLFVSVGAGNPDTGRPAIVGKDPEWVDKNFFYLWWKELTD